jgi:hypothetical protein
LTERQVWRQSEERVDVRDASSKKTSLTAVVVLPPPGKNLSLSQIVITPMKERGIFKIADVVGSGR